ncbi:MAG: hypothetical protein IT522_01525 [Burkholderiales bacterium]|nr:hypothetical protein [Burkholderiales bacterium]
MTGRAGRAGSPQRGGPARARAASGAGWRTLAAAVTVALVAGCAAAPPAPTVTQASGAGQRSAAAAATATPNAAAAVRRWTLVNPGFESPVPSGRTDPAGWFSFQHAGVKSFEFTLDAADPHGGAQSLRIDNTGPEPYGAIAQAVDVGPHRGKVARFSGWMRTRDVAGTGAVLRMAALSGGAIVGENFMKGREVTGTTGWTRYTLALPMPDDAGRLEIGAMLQGKGTLWLDDVELEFVEP